MAVDRSKELRRRAVHAPARTYTREGAVVAGTAILAEKDAALRREVASVRFAVQEIWKRADTAALVEQGLGDKDPIVRVVFAELAPADSAAALAVLRADGLKSGDHHVRESAAVQLGRRGDAARESVLIGMLARTKLPGVDGDDALMQRMLAREQAEVCEILGRIGSPAAKAALQRATASKLEAVRKAAAAALAAK
jgi:HEAT repeat protein